MPSLDSMCDPLIRGFPAVLDAVTNSSWNAQLRDPGIGCAYRAVVNDSIKP